MLETMRDQTLFRSNSLFVEVPTQQKKKIKKIRKDKEKYRAAGDLDRQRTERPDRKFFGCRYVHHIINKCLKPPRYDYKQRNNVHFDERGNCES